MNWMGYQIHMQDDLSLASFCPLLGLVGPGTSLLNLKNL